MLIEKRSDSLRESDPSPFASLQLEINSVMLIAYHPYTHETHYGDIPAVSAERHVMNVPLALRIFTISP